MDRKDFLRSLGLSAGTVFIATCMGGCSKSSDSDSDTNPGTGGGPGALDFTFDVTTDANLVANGWTVRNGAIIARQSNGTYLAYEAACPHQAFPLTYNRTNNTFPCSQTDASHGSVFDADGKRLAGPAPRNLKKYTAQLSGNSLRVFA